MRGTGIDTRRLHNILHINMELHSYTFATNGSMVCLMHSLSKTFTIKSRSWWGIFTYISRQRPYHVEYTSSRSITEVKQRRARLVLGWETAWEHRVLLAFYFLVLKLDFFLAKGW